MGEQEPTIRSRELGEALRAAMERVHMSGKRAADLLGWSESKVSRVLTGRLAIKGIAWRKSSYSGDNGGCVEIGWPESAGVAVRDSKYPTGPTLSFPTTNWQTFLTSKNTLD